MTDWPQQPKRPTPSPSTSFQHDDDDWSKLSPKEFNEREREFREKLRKGDHR